MHLLMSSVQWLCMLEEYKGNCRNCPDSFLRKLFFCLHRLQEKYWLRQLFSSLEELLVLVDKTSSSWRAELHQAATGQEPKSGAAILPPWVTSENPSRTAMQTLSLEVGGWRGLRKRSHMGNCLPWVLIGTVQDGAADAAHFQYDPPVT